ncbi:MAG: hypothetical protein ACHQNA_07480 [Acidimicrobiales bacterium]
MSPGRTDVRSVSFAQLDSATLYRILRLRAEVFVVEQACVFNDLDGRDIEADAVHLWVDPHPGAPTVSAALRLLVQPDGGRKLSRIDTAPAARGTGNAGA